MLPIVDHTGGGAGKFSVKNSDIVGAGLSIKFMTSTLYGMHRY